MRTSAPTGRTALERRQRVLLVAAWGATLMPLVVFGLLTWKSYQLNRQVEAKKEELLGAKDRLDLVRKDLADAQKALDQLNADLQAQRQSTKHYRDFAGVRIQFYRESDRQVVQRALLSLGFNIDSRLGRSPLVKLRANTIAYGSLVSTTDLRDIAAALVESQFPLRRITPARRQPDPKLIQVYASAESERDCGLLTVGQIRAGLMCGPMPTPSGR